MSVIRPGDGPPGDDVPGNGSPGWEGGDQADDAGALDGSGLLGSDGGQGLGQGLWLTASAPLPPGLASSVAAGGGTGVFGFGQGGVLEALPPGPVLAAFAAEAAGGICGTGVPDPAAADLNLGVKDDGRGLVREAGQLGQSSDPGRLGQSSETGQLGQLSEPGRLGHLSDEELIGLIRSHRRQASAAQAGELAAVAELAARRRAEAQAGGVRDCLAADAGTEEIAAALTLTGRAAQLLTSRAAEMTDLPRTFATLAAGQIDMPRALVLLTGLAGQEPELAHAVEAQVLGRAPAQTTGQLRACLNRALLAADPAAAERRRQREEKYARIEQTPEPGGVTATLGGRYLPVTATVAAWNRISALARQLKGAGADGSLDELRVQVYLALLTGQAAGILDGLTTAAGQPGSSDGKTSAGLADADRTSASGDMSPARSGTDRGGAVQASPPKAGASGAPTGRTEASSTGAAGPSASGTGAGTTGTSSTDDGSTDDGSTDDGSTDDGSTDDGSTDDGSTDDGTSGTGTSGTGTSGTDGAETEGTGASAWPGTASPASPVRLGGLAEPARLSGTVNLTVPLATLLGITDAPGELGAFGPVTAFTARQIATQAMDAPAVRWCVTVTDDTGAPVGHGCARPGRRRRRKDRADDAGSGNAGSGDWAIIIGLRAIAAGSCDHERESGHYRIPPSLWHLIQTRNQRCTAPGCRMPAAKCDDDHTVPYEKGGRSCECNLGPLCRHHHRVKQLQGWRLEQPEPGVLAWVTPSGWKYITGPTTHAA
jgi:hypothetical protein